MKVSNNIISNLFLSFPFTYFLFIIVCISFIVLYGIWRCMYPKYTDPFTQTLIGGPSMSKFTDGWGIFHFIFFGLITYAFPQYIVHTFIFGIIWEIIESLSKSKPFYTPICNTLIDTDQVQGWWYGRWQDIVMNTLGQAFGLFLNKIRASWLIFPFMYITVVYISYLKVLANTTDEKRENKHNNKINNKQ